MKLRGKKIVAMCPATGWVAIVQGSSVENPCWIEPVAAWVIYEDRSDDEDGYATTDAITNRGGYMDFIGDDAVNFIRQDDPEFDSYLIGAREEALKIIAMRAKR